MFTISRNMSWNIKECREAGYANKNKPLLLRPSGKDYLWGGRRLNDEFEKRIDLSPLAETWECSTHPDGPSYVVGGEYDGTGTGRGAERASRISGGTA